MGPKARGEGSDSEVSLSQIVDLESVGVNSVRAEVHQLVNPLGVDIVEIGAGSFVADLENFLSAVGKVGNGLEVGGVGEGKHFS